jgi:P4 family phage/plasmid primase-like protien
MHETKNLAVVTFDGSRDTLIAKQGSRYNLITFDEIVSRTKEPTAVPKTMAPATIPSSYCEHDARSHRVQREKGLFHFLCVDVDKGSPDLQDIRDVVMRVLGNCAGVIYSTASSSRENMKWRVIVLLGTPLLGADYTSTASALFDLLAEQGIECDRSLDRTGQPVFLPNVPIDRRDQSAPGSPPLFYQFEIFEGPPLDIAATRIPERRAAIAAEEEMRDNEVRAAAELRRADRAASTISGVVSLIDTYNANHDLTEVLCRYGYRYGGNDNWRSPHQQGKSFATKVYGNKWFSLSTSDGDVGAAARSGGRFGDAFDLFVHYEHAGDVKAATRALWQQQQGKMAEALWEVRNHQQVTGTNPPNVSSMSAESNADNGVPELIESNVGGREGSDGQFVGDGNSKLGTFEEALAALMAAPNDKQARDNAIDLYSHLGAIERALAENTLSKVLGLPKTALRAAAKAAAATLNGPSDLTHSEMADAILNEYTRLSNVPVGNAGSLFFYDQTGIWKKMALKEIEVFVGRKFRSQKNAKRAGDYAGVTRVLYNSIEDDDFFAGASPGICTTDGFWKEDGSNVVMVPHSKDNRARHKLNVEPDFSQDPALLITVLREAFSDPNNSTSVDEQIRLVRQLIGATILGSLPSYQMAIFLYGAPGSGKSLILRILGAMFDPKDVTVVSPHELDQDYKKAMLAHKRLNIVPELSSEKPIPSAEFKAMVGQDRVSARLPYQEPFTYTCDAACWFNGNAMPVTRDHGEAFYRRWIIVHFRNSKPQALRDSGLYERIIADELAKIAGWAIEGARDLLANGLALSQAHDQQLKNWQQEASSVASWLADAASESYVMTRGYEEGKQGTSTPIHRARAYRLYKSWCISVTRKPLGINAWGLEMEKLGHTPTKTSGDYVFHSLKEVERANGNAFGVW